jgi:hypothetical protein
VCSILQNHGPENRQNGGQGAFFVPKDTKYKLEKFSELRES